MEQASGHGQRDREVHDPARRNAQKRAARKRQRECSARQRRRTSRADDTETQPAARRLFESNARGSLEFSIPMKQIIAAGALALFALAVGPRAQQPPSAPPPTSQQPNEVGFTITGEGGAPPRLAVPDFIALSTDGETVAIAKTIGQVLWDDL